MTGLISFYSHINTGRSQFEPVCAKRCPSQVLPSQSMPFFSRLQPWLGLFVLCFFCLSSLTCLAHTTASRDTILRRGLRLLPPNIFRGRPRFCFALWALVCAQATGQRWLLVDDYQALVGQWLAIIGHQQSVAVVTIFLLVDVELWIACKSHANSLGNDWLVEQNVVHAVILLLNGCCGFWMKTHFKHSQMFFFTQNNIPVLRKQDG